MDSAVDRSKLEKFKRGSIVRIELTNFMIYKHVVFMPGAFLNLVLGPNGSGKSAFVCAIIMGCAGDPSITGRSLNLGDYIRFNSQMATIVIEFYSGSVDVANMIVERQIRSVTKNNKPECTTNWKLNGRTAQKKEVSDFIKSLLIDINNLCQVLPQERVVEFSRLTPKELLVSTEKSIGNANLYDNHMRLIQLSNEATTFETAINNCNAFIMKLNSYKTNIEPDMKLLQQKKKFEKELDWLKKKKFFLEYEVKRSHYAEIKDVFTQKRNEYTTASSQLTPITARVEKCVALLGKLQSKKTKTGIFMKQSSDKILKWSHQINQIDHQIAKDIDEFNETESNNKKLKEKLATLESNKINFENDLQNAKDDGNFENKVAEIDAEIREIDHELQQVENKTNAEKQRLEKAQYEKKCYQSRKDQLGDIFNLRLSKLARDDSSTKRASDWLNNNLDNFSGNVFHPTITYINVLKPEYVKYVEMAIGNLDLGTFLFEKKEDLQLFTEKLESECGIRVNVAMLPRDMFIEHCDRDFVLERFTQFGIFASIRDLFDAPDPVMVYLCKTYNLHRIPVGNHVTEAKIQELMEYRESNKFKRIFTSNNMYNIVVSTYDHTKSTKINAIRPERYLNVIINKVEMDQVNQKLESIDREIYSLETQIGEDKLKIEKIVEKRRTKREVRGTFTNKKDAVERLKRRLVSQLQQIEEVKKLITAVDDAKEVLAGKLNTLHVKQLKIMADMSSTMKACVEHTSSEAVFITKIHFVKKIRSQYSEQKEGLEAELKILEDQLKEMNVEVRKARDIAKAAFEEAKIAVGSEFTEEVQEKMSTLPGTFEEIESAIAVLRLRCQGIANIDDSVLEQYHKYQKDITEKNSELAKLEEEAKKVDDEIQAVRPIWVNSLKQLIGQIDKNFGNFMTMMKYSGEVYLYEGEKENAYEEYGIRIRVKFRDAEQLKDLDAFHQSGGERSVSTMVYMLSLQELANVPFRVVDEINQGMDDRNERLVFDLISRVSRKNSSQYFLLSPKLLPRLNYSQECTVHIIMNAPLVFADLFKTIKQLAKNKPLNVSNGDVTESEEEMEEEVDEEEDASQV